MVTPGINPYGYDMLVKKGAFIVSIYNFSQWCGRPFGDGRLYCRKILQ